MTVDPARAGDDEVRIAVLADLQTNGVGDHERRAIDEVLAAEPDDGAVTILMSLRPDTVLRLPPTSRVDLTVAAHPRRPDPAAGAGDGPR